MSLSGAITRLLAGRMASRILLVLLVIEGVFLAEELTGILEGVLRNDGGALAVASILLLTGPEIVDFALPLACLIGVYVVLVAARDEREFIVCSSAGISWNRITGFVAAIGGIAFLVNLFVAGYLSPLAFSAKRALMENLQVSLALRQISRPGLHDRREEIEGRTFIGTSSGEGERERGHLFIYSPDGENGRRVTQADDWTVRGPDRNGSYVISFRKVTDYEIRTPANRSEGRPPRLTAVQADNVSLATRLASVLSAGERMRQEREFTFLEALETAGDEGAVSGSTYRRAGEMLGRALLAPISCLFALAAAMLTSGGLARFLALPAAAIGVLAFDTVSRATLADAASDGLAPLLLSAMLVFAAAAAPLLLFAAGQGPRLVTPAGARA